MGLTGMCAACFGEDSDSGDGRHGGIETRAAVSVDECRDDREDK